jgi:hypothetical protein
MAIEKCFPKAPADVIYVCLSFMQKWSCLLKEVEEAQIIRLKEEILKWLKEFKPSSLYLLSDVVEI